YTDPVYAGALSVANERRMPVLLHAWGAASDFAAIRELAAKYPEASFLFAHSGTGGAEAECIRLAREVPNAYLDLAYSQGPRGLVERLVAGAGAEKVLFGSDCYFFSMTQQIGKVLGADLSDGEKRKILSENALRILERVQR
ncbi:MAG TPA: amidohydrolase family protein, partial [Armatimonadota bacterium]|nr:amidohydrolase family protein [Armatimonadota bacterium]